MKIAVIADIHANQLALQTIIADVESWRPDRVVILGDIINRGPRPLECLNFVLEKARCEGWILVRGNHEEYVISFSKLDSPLKGAAKAVHQPSYWTYTRLGCNVTSLLNMPLSAHQLDPLNQQADFYHGSVRGLRDGIHPHVTDQQLKEMIGLTARNRDDRPLSLFCAGHTHWPLIRKLDGVQVVNAGSAGLPFDIDTRPAYARLIHMRQGWAAEIVRLDYNVSAAEQDFHTTGYLEEGGPLIRLVQRELLTARSHLYTWALHYQDPVLRGEITLDDSVTRHLSAYP